MAVDREIVVGAKLRIPSAPNQRGGHEFLMYLLDRRTISGNYSYTDTVGFVRQLP